MYLYYLMLMQALKSIFIVLFSCLSFVLFSQRSYSISSSYKHEECTKGAAGIQLEGVLLNDTLSIDWSNGKSMVYSIDELTAGDYNVRIKIKNKLDTTIAFKIEKIECPVIMETHFTPNGDNYNDEWDIYNTQFFPDFELYVFNKWGQQVMKQKGTYTKWDGKMGSVDVADGTYYYVFYYKSGDSKHLKGDVTILR